MISKSDNHMKEFDISKCDTIEKTPLWKLSISGEIVKELQEELNKEFKGTLSVDGYFGEETLNLCPVIKISSKGKLVEIIQRRLIYFAYTYMKFGSDGVFLNETLKAVEDFQIKKGLTVSGVIDKDTWKALFKK